MDTKPPTRTLPKLVMKEWPTTKLFATEGENIGSLRSYSIDALGHFTRVVEETGILDQERSQKEKSR